jgi:hypothetical protein
MVASLLLSALKLIVRKGVLEPAAAHVGRAGLERLAGLLRKHWPRETE